MPVRGTRLLRSRALGAIVAQVGQALGSLGLQLLAAWLLGASGLGLLSLCLSIIVLATAVTSGMVGDSLVILDRHDRRVRGGLQFWAGVLAVGTLMATVVAMPLSGVLDVREAVLMALALAAFQIEELVRRILMATMRFWRVVVIDGAAVLVALAVIGVWAQTEPVVLSTFFVALLVGQLVGILLGVALLPATERRLVSLRGAGIKQVAGFGVWRGAQVSIGPLVLTTMRIIVTAMAGATLLGQLELARIYIAPATLCIQGLGSYLLSSYVRDKAQPMSVLVRRAWRASAVMMVAAVLVGTGVTMVIPLIGPRVSGPDVAVDQVALAGWALYVVASASCQPFASLAAARGRPARVLGFRVIDAVFVVGLLPVLLAIGISASWTPCVLAAGLFLGGALVRQFALKPLVRADVAPSSTAAVIGLQVPPVDQDHPTAGDPARAH